MNKKNIFGTLNCLQPNLNTETKNTHSAGFKLHIKLFFLLCTTTIALLALASFIIQLSIDLPTDAQTLLSLKQLLSQLFSIDGKLDKTLNEPVYKVLTVPIFFRIQLLLFGAASCTLIGSAERLAHQWKTHQRQEHFYPNLWFYLAFCFYLVVLDTGISLHHKFIHFFHQETGLNGIGNFLFTLFASLICILFFANFKKSYSLILRAIKNKKRQKKFQKILFLGFALFLGSALGLDTLSKIIENLSVFPSVNRYLSIVEQCLEMIGLSLLDTAFLYYIQCRIDITQAHLTWMIYHPDR